MSQFMLYRNEDDSSNETYPYFIDIQNTLLADLNSRVVIPLSPHAVLNNTDVKKLCPVIEVDGINFVLLSHQMTSVPKSILKSEVASLESQRYKILDAVDMLISGI
ncbi:MAG: CcdB family protein [gamma proteobacterium endosymbiont of Lamellibrachia anaximandri]|nr:CcdB family protein [gamma proteobacterium endosymbiont of Lamellibrachia anaximandri]MBL3535792.1 CcdB family protein [gamma proteobacterium endosymbiont of Lamellibrachia anaximandri]